MNTDESYKKNGWLVKHLGIKEQQTLSATMAEKKKKQNRKGKRLL